MRVDTHSSAPKMSLVRLAKGTRYGVFGHTGILPSVLICSMTNPYINYPAT
jgi:hypothetical protein